MDVVERLAGHGPLLEGLWRAAREGRLGHALSFEGPAGIGKFAAAKELALGLLCARGPGTPCRACGPCKRVLTGGWRGNHPDLFVLDPHEEAREQKTKRSLAIRIHRIAPRPDSDGEDDGPCVQDFLSLVAVERGWRIVVVRDAEAMVPAAQNALLKTLEEPGQGTLIALVTARPGALLATIRSRVVRLRLRPLGAEDAARILGEQGLPAQDARRLGRWSAGAPGEALRLAREGALETLRVAADVARGARSPSEATRALFDAEGDFAEGTAAAQGRARARSAVDAVLALCADARRAAEGAGDELLADPEVARELAPRFAGAAGRRSVELLFDLRRDLEANVTPELAVERALLLLADRP